MNVKSLSILLLAGCVCSQPSIPAQLNFTGPLCGYYFDPSVGGIRPIIGTPGAATQGPVMTSSFDSVWIAPNGLAALALMQGNLKFVGNVGASASLISLAAWTDPIDRVIWSSDSSGALIYSAARGTLRAVTGLPGSPTLGSEIGLEFPGGSLSGLRLSTAPWNVAAIVKFERSSADSDVRRAPARAVSSLYLFPRMGSPVLISGISIPGPMDFSSDGTSLYVVDQKAGQVMTVPVASPTAIRSLPVVSPAQAPSDFTDLEASGDGKFLYAPQSAAQTVCAIEISSGNTAWCAPLDLAPTFLRQFSTSLYLLNSPTDATTPLWLLDGTRGSAFFVPRGGQN